MRTVIYAMGAIADMRAQLNYLNKSTYESTDFLYAQQLLFSSLDHAMRLAAALAEDEVIQAGRPVKAVGGTSERGLILTVKIWRRLTLAVPASSIADNVTSRHAVADALATSLPASSRQAVANTVRRQ